MIIHFYFQGFSRVAFSPGEVSEIICGCEERLIKAGVHDGPFTNEEIKSGILKQHLIEEDYAAPFKV